jgi:hypothetical protein
VVEETAVATAFCGRINAAKTKKLFYKTNKYDDKKTNQVSISVADPDPYLLDLTDPDPSVIKKK